MARCRCTHENCICSLTAGDNVEVVGAGSPTNPWVVSSAPTAEGVFRVEDTTTIDMVLSGQGTTLDPYTLRANASQAPGGISVTDGITGTGSGLDPLKLTTDQTVWRFASVAERDLLWPTPPQGAVCWTDVENPKQPNEGIYWEFQGSRWWPKGEMLYTTALTSWTLPADNVWWGVPPGTVHVNVGDCYKPISGEPMHYRWQAPYTGLVEFVASATMWIGSGNPIIGDYQGAMCVYWRNAALTPIQAIVVGNHQGRWGMTRQQGSSVVIAHAGEWFELAILINGAQGQTKKVVGDNGVFFQARYIGAGYPAVPLTARTDDQPMELISSHNDMLANLGLPPLPDGDLPALPEGELSDA